MIISTNQPYFAPYAGFFHKAHLSDYFVILDDVQLPRKTTWITRNRFKNDQGALWMTIPVHKKGLGLQKISDVRICQDGNWKTKHTRSIENAYARAPYLTDHLNILKKALTAGCDRILDLNMEIIKAVCDHLQIDTEVVLMSELGVSGKGVPLILDICKSLGATQFLVQSSALTYYDAKQFKSEGVELASFRKPDYVYPQLWGDFIDNLSILDMMFNCSPKIRDIVLASAPPDHDI